MLLLRGKPASVATWARRGLVPVHVVPLEGWTAVLPAGPSQAMPPYDDTLKALAGRPVASRLRTAIGLFAIDGKAVITVHPPGWRAIQKWFVWSPGQGVVQARPLVAGRPVDLLAAAGVHDGAARRGVRDLLLQGRGDARGVLGELLVLLALPGSELLLGEHDLAAPQNSTMVEPREQHVARFERIISIEAHHRVELEED
jgi:hypothetical protein